MNPNNQSRLLTNAKKIVIGNSHSKKYSIITVIQLYIPKKPWKRTIINTQTTIITHTGLNKPIEFVNLRVTKLYYNIIMIYLHH